MNIPRGIEATIRTIFSKERRIPESAIRVVIDTYKVFETRETEISINIVYNPTMGMPRISYSVENNTMENLFSIDPNARAQYGCRIRVSEEDFYNDRSFNSEEYVREFITYTFANMLTRNIEPDVSVEEDKRTIMLEKIREVFPQKPKARPKDVRKVRYS